MEINAALATHFAPIEAARRGVCRARAEAREKHRPEARLDARRSPRNSRAQRQPQSFIAKNPDNYTALTRAGRTTARGQGNGQAAKAPLQKLIELYPEQHEADSAYAMLARVHRELGETERELATLTKLADLAADAADAFERLMQLARGAAGLAEGARLRRALSAPSIRSGRSRIRREAEASEALGENPAAIAAYRTLLQLGPADPADIHYRLAQPAPRGARSRGEARGAARARGGAALPRRARVAARNRRQTFHSAAVGSDSKR